ncbi:MAG: hypothetical protein FWF06_07840 [Symbiobacteriaceae bacterium]|nr:hypothetical protein [Symbiobacteriaceae bacterium]
MLTTETVIGSPLVFGQVTIVPVVTVSFGFGSGGGGRSGEGESSPLATGATAGAKLTPVAFLSIHEDGSVNLHHVKYRDGFSAVDRLLEMAPGLLDKISYGVNRMRTKSEKSASETEDTAAVDPVTEALGEILQTNDAEKEHVTVIAKPEI